MTMIGAVGRELLDVLNRWGGPRELEAPLDPAEPRARHYILAGVVSDSFAYGPSILEIGCGPGATYGLLRRLRPSYRGVDRSRDAVARCRERFGDDSGAAFEVGTLERVEPGSAFDVIILNGVLDSLPLGEIRPALERAISMLQGTRSQLIVASAQTPRASLVWAGSIFMPMATHRVSVTTRGARGSSGWTIRAYTNLRGDRAGTAVHRDSAPS